MARRQLLGYAGRALAVVVLATWIAPPATVEARLDDLAKLPLSYAKRQTHAHNVFRAGGYGDQCTAYALERMHAVSGQWMKVRGHAYQWADEARAAGWIVGTKPAIKSVMVMPPAPGYQYTLRELDGEPYKTAMHPLGHVAWVEEIEGDWALIADQNWRRGTIGKRWVLLEGAPLEFIYSNR